MVPVNEERKMAAGDVYVLGGQDIIGITGKIRC
jgi:hypothetical protein